MAKKVSPLMILPPLVFAGLAVMFYVGMFREDPNALPSTRIGQPAPAVTEEALPGYAPLTAADLATGEVTILNFWASWCPPCRAEHPILMDLAEQGFHLVAVNFKDDADNATAYLAEEGNPFQAVAFDPQGRTAIDWGVTAPPETFILSGDGTVLYRFAGPLVGSDLEQRFLPELRKAIAAQ
jgi:cytochrome c biogenesis protein CcmG/thiol:disulfide interchange protein DsbE